MAHVTRSRCGMRGGNKNFNRRLYDAERLEQRRLLAAVSWDGGGDGINWTNNLNWSTNALPGPADDVTISVAANPTVLIPSGTQSIRSLVSDELIRTTGGTLAVFMTAAASQSVTLAGGGLTGGAWSLSGGASIIATSSGGTLSNVAITGGDLLLNTSSATVLLNGTTSFPAARLQAASTLQMAPGYVLNSLVVAEGAAAGQRTISLAVGGPGTVTIGASAVVRLAAGCGGNLSLQNNSISTLLNNGLITAEAAGRSLLIQNSTFTNSGTAQVTDGTLTLNSTNWSNPGAMTAASGTTLNFNSDWSNPGMLSINAATLNLAGNFATSGFNFAGFTRNAGAVNLTGTLDNAASTLTLNGATGNWNLSSGTINDGAVDQTGGSILAITSSGGTLHNVALSGDLLLNTTSASLIINGTTTFAVARLQAGCNLGFGPGYVINSLIVAEGAATGQRTIALANGGTGTVTIAPGAITRLAAGCGGNLSLQNSSASTLVNNGLITNEAAGRSLLIQNSTFTNNATTQVTAGTLTISSTNWSNPGSITAASGTTVSFSGNWSNAGMLSINSATLNLGGNFATAGFNFAGFSRTGGTVNFTGTLDNTASTLTLNAATGTWNLLNGTINNGSVDQAGGSTLAITTSGGTLINVAHSADLLLNVASASVRVSGTTSFPAARLQAGCTLLLATDYVLNSLIIAEGASTGQRTVSLAVGGPGAITIAPAAVVRLDASCGGNLSLQNNSIATLVNNGLITNEAAGRTLFVQNDTFTNNATTQVTAGTLQIHATNWSNPGAITAASGTTLSFSGAWSNAGTLSVNSATLTLGGTFATPGFNFAGFTRTGGTVNLTGTLDNTASTLTLNAATGTWNLSGGTINNGLVNQAGGSLLAMSAGGGTLKDVAVTGDLLFDVTSAHVLVTGSTSFPVARLRANGASLRMPPGYTLNSLVVAEGAASGQRTISLAVGGAGDVTIAPTAEIRLAAGCGGNLSIQNSSIATLINNGMIFAEAAGRTLFIQNSALTHTGTLFASAGTLAVTPGFTNAGGFGVAAGAAMTVGGDVINASGAQFSAAGRLAIAGLLDIKSGSLALAQPGGTAVIRVNSIQIPNNNLLDLNDNDLIVDYAPADPSPLGTWNGSAYTGLIGLVNSGRAGGAWNGPGIRSTVAGGMGGKTSLGIAESSQVLGAFGGTFSGESVDGSAVLIKYTWSGDATLDGKINIDDYGRIDGNVAQSGSVFGWYFGDFNYDGKINIDDYGIIDGTIGQQTGILLVEPNGRIADLTTPTPAAQASQRPTSAPPPSGIASPAQALTRPFAHQAGSFRVAWSRTDLWAGASSLEQGAPCDITEIEWVN